MKKISLKEFRDLLDELNILHKKIGESNIEAPLFADQDFDKTVSVIFNVEESKLQAFAFVKDYGSELDRKDALEICNDWNIERCVPKARIDKDGDFNLEVTVFQDEEISKEFIKNNFISLAIASSWQFFCELKKKLEERAAKKAENPQGDDAVTARFSS